MEGVLNFLALEWRIQLHSYTGLTLLRVLPEYRYFAGLADSPKGQQNLPDFFERTLHRNVIRGQERKCPLTNDEVCKEANETLGKLINPMEWGFIIWINNKLELSLEICYLQVLANVSLNGVGSNGISGSANVCLGINWGFHLRFI